ncbi:hypothetical protein [Synechocystis sp. FACHB-383]|nr:hypothetical protein [Synechocystis sp. FACHB-383]
MTSILGDRRLNRWLTVPICRIFVTRTLISGVESRSLVYIN